jgi:hypothetical protein
MRVISTDVLVVGGGAAGCAAAFLSSRSRRTTLISSGGSATSLSTGCICFRERSGLRAAERFLDAVGAAGLPLEWAARILTGIGMERHVDALQKGMMTMRDVEEAGGVDILHFPSLRSSHAPLAVRCLRERGVAANVVTVDESFSLPPEGCAAAEMGKALGGAMSSCGGLVAVPPIWKHLDPAAMLEAAGREAGREVRELVSPAGPQGKRLQTALEAAARPADMMTGTDLVGLRFDGRSCAGARLRSGLREFDVECGAVIMASGGLLISRPDWAVGLDLEMSGTASIPATAPVLRCRRGVATRHGEPLRNVFVCGSALAGRGFLDGCGIGDCITSAFEACAEMEAVI